MLKNLIVFVFLSNCVGIQSSENEEKKALVADLTGMFRSLDSSVPAPMSQVSSSRILLTSVQTAEMRRKQAAAVAAQPQVIEVGTDDTLRAHIWQMFSFDNKKYRGIWFKSFSELFFYKVEEFTEEARNFSCVEPRTLGIIYKQYTKVDEAKKDLPTGRTFSVLTEDGESEIHTIVGVRPFKEGFRDALFDVGQAKTFVVGSTQQFIDDNYQAVSDACQPKRKSRENEILETPCCRKPIHKPCAIACQENRIGSCGNDTCQVAENGVFYSMLWTPAMYGQLLQSKPLKRKQIPNRATCFLCAESVKPFIDGELPTSRKKSKKQY